jgi:hypothetical protein
MIEADIKNGRITGPESWKLPAAAHVLIIIPRIEQKQKQPDWDAIKAQFGKLKLRGDTVRWQKKIRAEWE